jgi:hypothetical protein
MLSMTQKVDAFNIKEGPTESGVDVGAVGGELLPFNLIESLPLHVIILMILMTPAFLLLYKKRDYALNLIARILF